ncbi:MAG: DNA-binding response regulator [Sulfuricurvum sp. PD_MW2]|jgi:YesN/AraC family two-component response regulator|uniref:response regulator n=1 Tax=Sulfuricurvum sp. PD_MW2 TaxID=2027917 RepID=UPI000C063881|nr:response regulator [Sulfuricurvum sp. PD_MW2]PHM16768.1 MAG: DNA-binding response regulator [Sulfuricurvum sp. PD_MW2]
MSHTLTKYNVLIVDDELPILNQMSYILEDFVANVYTASDGLEALDMLSKHKIDIVITDLLMPNMHGITLISEIKKRNLPLAAIIITTAHSETNYLLDAIKLRVDGYLLKPIMAEEMLDLIEKSIALKAKEDELWLKDRMLEGISTFVGGKKIEIIRYLFEHVDAEGVFYGSYEDIMSALNVSKPTVVSTFKQLIEVGIVTKLKNKIYKVNTSSPAEQKHSVES